MFQEPGNPPISAESFTQLPAGWHNMIKALVHHLNTALVVMRSNSKRIKEILPELFQGYHLALEGQLLEPQLNKRQLNVDTVDLENIITQELDFLDTLHAYSKALLAGPTEPPFYVAAFVQDYLAQYPWKEEQQQFFNLNLQYDFQTNCGSSFMQALMWNLLQIGISHINAEEKGEIDIWAQEESHYDVFHFKIRGKIWRVDTLVRSFDNFFMMHNTKMIPGLGFCRLKWLYMGGDILSQVEPQQYAHFIVKFPRPTVTT